MHRSRIALVGLIVVLAAGCGQQSADTPEAEVESTFHKELLQVAEEYKTWGRVDDAMRVAPLYCEMPRIPKTDKLYFSSSNDAGTHGQKLYLLFAKKQRDYLLMAKTESAPTGQIIVKESWVPEVTTEVKLTETDPKKIRGSGPGLHDAAAFFPYATKDGKVYKASKPAGLFVMMKFAPKTPDTDEGWVYGTISADGKQVTAAGKIESCMKCHVDAKFDRQFGQ